MIDFDLYDDVIVDFSKDEVFTRFTKTDNGAGRDTLAPILPAQSFFCYIHPASDKELQAVNQQGEHIEAMVKIFAKVDDDILPDDQVTYSGLNYRVLKSNIKLVGNYSKFFAGLVK